MPDRSHSYLFYLPYNGNLFEDTAQNVPQRTWSSVLTIVTTMRNVACIYLVCLLRVQCTKKIGSWAKKMCTAAANPVLRCIVSRVLDKWHSTSMRLLEVQNWLELTTWRSCSAYQAISFRNFEVECFWKPCLNHSVDPFNLYKAFFIFRKNYPLCFIVSWMNHMLFYLSVERLQSWLCCMSLRDCIWRQGAMKVFARYNYVLLLGGASIWNVIYID